MPFSMIHKIRGLRYLVEFGEGLDQERFQSKAEWLLSEGMDLPKRSLSHEQLLQAAGLHTLHAVAPSLRAERLGFFKPLNL